MTKTNEEIPFWESQFKLERALSMRQVYDTLSILAHTDLVPLILGHTGVGKTVTVFQWAEDQGYRPNEVYKLNMIGLEPSDLKGIPFPSEDGKTFLFLSDGKFPINNDNRKMLLFIDEVNRTEEMTINALFQLIDRYLGANKLGRNVKIIMAANPAGGSYSVANATADPAFLDRVRVLPCKLHNAEFLAHAKENDWHPKVLGFLQSHPEHMQAPIHELESGVICPTARSWNVVSKILTAWEIEHGDRYESLDMLQASMLRALLDSAVGVRTVDSFWTSIVNPDEDLSVEELLKDMSNEKSRAYRLVADLVEEGREASLLGLLEGLAFKLVSDRPPIADILPSLLNIYLLVNPHTYSAFVEHMNAAAAATGKGVQDANGQVYDEYRRKLIRELSAHPAAYKKMQRLVMMHEKLSKNSGM